MLLVVLVLRVLVALVALVALPILQALVAVPVLVLVSVLVLLLVLVPVHVLEPVPVLTTHLAGPGTSLAPSALCSVLTELIVRWHPLRLPWGFNGTFTLDSTAS